MEAARVRIEDIRLSLAARQNLTGIIAEEELRALRTDQRLAELALVEAEERKRIAELEVDRASARLALRRILSPFDGIVTERHLSPGELVDSGKPVLTVVQIDPLSIDTYLPVEFLGRVAVGDPVTENWPGAGAGTWEPIGIILVKVRTKRGQECRRRCSSQSKRSAAASCAKNK